ncbi:MAG: hypothetical protein ABSC93_28060 [Bryobacteraceae bacterium]
MHVVAEPGETRTTFRNPIEVRGGCDLFAHLSVGPEVGLGQHREEYRLWIHNIFERFVDSLDRTGPAARESYRAYGELAGK